MKIKNQKLKIKNDEEIEQLKNQLARALADYDNLRKRIERERLDIEKFVSLRLILRLLSVFDILESAQNHLKDQGLGIAISQFRQVLEEEGLEEIKPAKGDKFNHDIHEAVESVSGEKRGEIAEMVMSGWKYKDESGLPAGRQVVRIAKVKVSGENQYGKNSRN